MFAFSLSVASQAVLPAIEAGGALRALSTRLDPIVLRHNRRQQLAWERDAVEALRIGDGDRALELYEQKGRLHIGRTDDEVLPELVADWSAHRNPDETVMIAHRRADVAELSQPTQSGRPALEHATPSRRTAAQGMTCRHALVLARDDAYREWIYTTMTRIPGEQPCR